MIKGVDFIVQHTQDMPRAMAFYRDTLGLPLITEMEDFWIEFDIGGTVLAIMRPDFYELPFEPRVGSQVALQVDDVSASRSALEAKGIAFQGDILDTSVCHMAFFADPDGNAFMLHSRYAH